LSNTVEKASAILSRVTNEGRKALLETEAKAICMDYGIPVPKFALADNPIEAAQLAEQIGFPVVLKVVSPDIIHKSDAGGVMINLKNAAEVQSAYGKILVNAERYNAAAKINGVLVQEMALQSTEVIIGSVKDSQFGQTIMFGLGGIFVELFKDVAFRIAPISRQDAQEMITEVRSYPLLKGYRNTPPADIEAIVDILMRISRLSMDHQEIKEIDLNPVIVYLKGAKTVDARMILE
jgi:acyl-CoA synthetase (NDP forming)